MLEPVEKAGMLPQQIHLPLIRQTFLFPNNFNFNEELIFSQPGCTLLCVKLDHTETC